MSKVLCSVVVALAMASVGCTSIRANVGPKVAKAVNRYCEEPQEARRTLRTEVNGLIAPNSIVVTCAGDQ